MHLVPDSARAAALSVACVRLAAAVVGSAALAIAGCGGDSSGSEPGSGVPGLVAPIEIADCTDWKEGSTEERLGTIRQIREFTGGPVAGDSGATGAILDDEDAYDLFESYCANEFARGFKLYKLYGRAAAFSGENAQR
jgi:hypothetical protein